MTNPISKGGESMSNAERAGRKRRRLAKNMDEQCIMREIYYARNAFGIAVNLCRDMRADMRDYRGHILRPKSEWR